MASGRPIDVNLNHLEPQIRLRREYEGRSAMHVASVFNHFRCSSAGELDVLKNSIQVPKCFFVVVAECLKLKQHMGPKPGIVRGRQGKAIPICTAMAQVFVQYRT